MFFRPLRALCSLATTLIVLYVFFFVPIGRRTLCDHLKRIAATPEAHDLGRDVRGASERVVERARGEVAEGIAAAAGPSPVPTRSPRASRPPR